MNRFYLFLLIYFCNDFVLSSSILIHLFSLVINTLSLLGPGELQTT